MVFGGLFALDGRRLTWTEHAFMGGSMIVIAKGAPLCWLTILVYLAEVIKEL
jgi:hypothetical protein